MTLEVLVDFVDAVRAMRAAQVRWFKIKDPRYLREAKALEAKVDRLLREFAQPTLFPSFKEEDHV